MLRWMYRRIRNSWRVFRINRIRNGFANSAALAQLNKRYLRMNLMGQALFFERYAKIFRGNSAPRVDATWEVMFAGKIFSVPLKSESLWLDWDYALALSGHDVDVKLGYLALLADHNRPEVFLDVGTNYGTHSLIFLKSGVTSLSFEPNLSCHAYFSEICRLNAITPRLISAAVGSQAGEITIAYPDKETWLTSADPEILAQLRKDHTLIEQKTPVVVLDEFVDELRSKRVLLKIDTEGFELEVLKGAARLLSEIQPYIYFEALPASSHGSAITELLRNAGYQIVQARFDPLRPERLLAPSINMSHNYLAIPMQRWK